MKNYFHKMMSGYRALFFKICTFVLIFGICILFSFIIVYPLWLLATQHTQAYTSISLSLFSILLLFFIVKKSIRKYKHNPRRFFHSLIKKLILLSGLAAFFILIFSYRRILAFSALILCLILYGFIAFGLSEDRT